LNVQVNASTRLCWRGCGFTLDEEGLAHKVNLGEAFGNQSATLLTDAVSSRSGAT
jgi:hypothetical protein